MIARPLPAPKQVVGNRPGWRAARTASVERRARNRRLRYRSIGRIVATLSGLTFLVLIYLTLVANVTRLHYEIGKAQHDRARLVDRTIHYDDEIAQLESRDRLEALAARMGMREPRAYAVVELPAPRHTEAPRPHGVAELLPVVRSFVGVAPK